MKLPDVNLLVAAVWKSHEHHAAARAWLARNRRFATCPITELGLVRVLLQLGAGPEAAFARLTELIQVHRAKLVPADLSAEVVAADVTGHRQTTDAYLVRLAEHHGATLATFDAGLPRRFPAICEAVTP